KKNLVAFQLICGIWSITRLSKTIFNLGAKYRQKQIYLRKLPKTSKKDVLNLWEPQPFMLICKPLAWSMTIFWDVFVIQIKALIQKTRAPQCFSNKQLLLKSQYRF